LLLDLGTLPLVILWDAEFTTMEPFLPSELLTAITLTKLEEMFAEPSAKSTAI
jgi:hypothetical protein